MSADAIGKSSSAVPRFSEAAPAIAPMIGERTASSAQPGGDDEAYRLCQRYCALLPDGEMEDRQEHTEHGGDHAVNEDHEDRRKDNSSGRRGFHRHVNCKTWIKSSSVNRPPVWAQSPDPLTISARFSR